MVGIQAEDTKPMPHSWMNLARVSLSPCYLILPTVNEKTEPGEKPLAYVAILIGPPPRERWGIVRDGERVPLGKEKRS